MARKFIGPLPEFHHKPEEPSWVHNFGDTGFLILVAGLVLENVGHLKGVAIEHREQNRLTMQSELDILNKAHLEELNKIFEFENLK